MHTLYFSSLRIQTPFIRSLYYVRNAKKDDYDSRPEIPYWWRKSPGVSQPRSQGQLSASRKRDKCINPAVVILPI